MTFQEYLAHGAIGVNKEIQKTLKALNKDVYKIAPDISYLFNLYYDRSFGGKTLRGILVKLGYELAGGLTTDEILKPAAAIEIFQTSILAQDDVIDLSPTRRGKPTIYKALGGDHYAVSQAICLGDIGFFVAARLIAKSKFEDKFKSQSLAMFSQMIVNTAIGEMLDVELPRLKKRREKAVLTIHKLKTSYYTIIYPLSIGAVLAGGQNKLLSQIETFGENLGIAFQIQDDILGVFGDEKTLGKSVTSDIEEGKNTLLYTQALKLATPQQERILKKFYGKGHLGAKGHEEIKKVFRDTGSLDYSYKKAQDYVHEAKKVIPSLSKDLKMRGLFAQLADFLINRQR